MAVRQRAVVDLARHERHDGRLFDAVVGERVELLPAVDDLGRSVFIGQDHGAAAQLAPLCVARQEKTATLVNGRLCLG